MDIHEFDALFEQIVAHPLERKGFTQRGKSLYLADGDCQIAWKRVGGRSASPGAIAQIICFRHTFLRDKSERLPVSPVTEAGDYPWVISPDDLLQGESDLWQFAPERLMSLPFSRLVYADLSADDVLAILTAQRIAFLAYLAWAQELSLRIAQKQIAAHMPDWWIAQLWDEDYRRRLGPDSV